MTPRMEAFAIQHHIAMDDPTLRDLYEQKLSSDGDEAARLEYAEMKGIEKVARRMLKMEMDVEQIAQFTDFSVEHIQSLLKNLELLEIRMPDVPDFRWQYDLTLFDPDVHAMKALKVITAEECIALLEVEWHTRFVEAFEESRAKGTKEEYARLYAYWRAKDWVKWYARQYVEGINEVREEIACELLTMGRPIDQIAKVTHLTIEHIQSLSLPKN